VSYKKWVLVSVVLFSVGLVLGLVPLRGVDDFISENLKTLEELATTIEPFSLMTFVIILVKNSVALIFSFVLSPFFCLVPVLTLVLNGLILSFVSAMVINEESLGVLLLGLLPHGVFELPAIIIGVAASLSFGVAAMQSVFDQEKRAQLLPSLKQNSRYLLLALALLVPAAIVETFVTPLFLR